MNAEGIEQPTIVRLLMAEDVEVAVIREDSEALVADAVPLVEHLLDFKYPSLGLVREAEAERPLVSLVAGVTFDLEVQAHGTFHRPPFTLRAAKEGCALPQEKAVRAKGPARDRPRGAGRLLQKFGADRLSVGSES